MLVYNENREVVRKFIDFNIQVTSKIINYFFSAGITPEVMNEYIQMLMTRQQAAERSMGVDSSSLLNPRAESVSPAPQDGRTPPPIHPEALLQRFSLWNMYSNNMSQPRYPIAPGSPEVSSHSPPPASPEGQEEALDLGVK